MHRDVAIEEKSEAGGPRPWTARERGQVRRVVAAVVVLAVFFCFQLTGAILARSDVLRAEALHILTDMAALGLALLAMHIARYEGSGRLPGGLHRTEPIAAIINAVLLLGATAFLVVDAVRDLRTGVTPDADIMLLVAVCAVVINGVSAWVIHGAIDPMHQHGHLPHADAEADVCKQGHVYVPGHELHEGHALNLRGAFLHLAGDALGSTAAVVAAVLLRLGVSRKADPIATFVVAIILVYASVRLIRDAAQALRNRDEFRRDT